MKNERRLGYSLVELAIVLGIIAVVMGGALVLFTASLEGRSYQATQARLEELKKALYDYRLAYNRLPCPADNSLALSHNNYGVEAATSSNCTGGTPAAQVGASNAAFGMVPVRTLGLPDEDAFDGWGRRIAYGVSTPFVAANSFTSIPLTNATARLTVENAAGVDIATTAAFVLVSHGKNGHGGYSVRTGATVNAGSTNSAELINSKRNGSFTLVDTNIATYVMDKEIPDPTDSQNNFDDQVVFMTRAQLRGANE